MTTKPENTDSKDNAIISIIKKGINKLKCRPREILKENQADKKTTFLKLTPDSKEKNHDTYTSALDFAFNDREIKNIALTGPYGSGKTTIWARYVKQKETKDKTFKNIISVALGKYDCALNTSDKVADKDNPDKLTQAEENRLEKQLIQQIAAQIPSKKIPLSKFKAKENKSRLALVTTTFTLLLIASVFLWFGRNSVLLNNFFLNSGFSLFYAKTIFYTLISIAFFSTSGCFIYRFLNNYQLHFSKIAFYGTEANLSEADDFKESVFDQELKEIVYLLKQSGAKIIVFEDIDRYDDLSLFTKLRELNFILNKNLEASGKAYTVRFIYLLKDSLLESKTRTKFFDFIIPVVPVITAHNSEDKLSVLLEDVGMNCLSDSFIFNVSLYIDDMRLLKNIVNEFKLYKDLINLNLKESSSEEDKKEAHNKLFSILLIKNIFPYEFDELQAERGCFKTLIDRLENELNLYKNHYLTWTQKDKEQFIQDKKIALFHMTLEISRGYKYHPKIHCTAIEDHLYFIVGRDVERDSENYFLKKVDTNTEEDKPLSSFIGYGTISAINNYCKNLKETLDRNPPQTISELLNFLHSTEKNYIFKYAGETIYHPHFNLISFLLNTGYLDNSYAYYMNHFYTDALKINDKIYLRNLFENNEQSIFLEIESPKKIFERLNPEDFMKFNAINITLINYLLELSSDKSKESIEKILDNSNSYQFVEFILNELNQNGAFHKDIEDYMSKNLLLSKFDKIDYLSNYEDIETIEITEDEMKFFERLASGCLSFTQNKPLSEAQKNNADASKYLYKIINQFLKENDKLLILAASLINNHLDKSLLTLYIMPLEEIADMINI